MMVDQIMYNQCMTSNNIVCEEYIPSQSRSTHPICIFAGMGVFPQKADNNPSGLTLEQKRERHFLGSVPYTLAEMLNVPVFVIYQPGVSGKPHKNGFYSDDTDRLQFDAAVEITETRGFYPITHSWSSRLGLDFVLEEEYKDANILDGAISSVMTTARDALTYKFGEYVGKERSVFDLFAGGKGVTGFPTWLQAFQVLQHFPLCLPTHPLQWQHWQDGKEDISVNPNWTVDRWIHYQSAKTFLLYDGLLRVEETRTRYRKPIFVITENDGIFTSDHQRAIATVLRAETVEIETGHRWFTAKWRELDTVLWAIVQHYNTCVSKAVSKLNVKI